MTVQQLVKSVEEHSEPASDLSVEGKVLWFAKAGEWDRAHTLCQDISGGNGYWLHAWLHRQEGDLGNAAYWYSLAGKAMPESQISAEEEWFAIAGELIER